MNQYFSHCPESGFQYHSTLEEARQAFVDNAEQNFDGYIDGPASEDDVNMVTGCCYGSINGFAQIDQRPATEEDKEACGDDIDYFYMGWRENRIIGQEHGKAILLPMPNDNKIAAS